MHLSIWDNSFCQRMSMMTSDNVLYLEDNRRQEDRSRLNCLDVTNGHTSLTGGQNDAELLPCNNTPGNTSPKYRRHGSRLGGVKVRHKRQALQDMARPLKHWLYKHRDNPYPTKTEKVLLALGSHMTLVQVSNWFANARRRLKNTVRQPDLSWALRIKLYNKYIQGNAERLSVSSDDTNSEDEEFPLQASVSQLDFGRSPPHNSIHHKHQGSSLNRASSAHSDHGVSPPSKYKSSLLNRYLNDTLRHVMAATADDVATPRHRRSHSGSFSSNECDEDLVSPASSSETETNFVYHADAADYASTKCDSDQPQDRGQQRRQDQEWREIHAAMALTNLAQGQSCATGPASATGRSCTRGPTTTTRTTSMGKIYAAAGGPGTATRQSCSVGPIITAASYTTGPTITSCIIQKSSHISEIKTVKVALANSV